MKLILTLFVLIGVVIFPSCNHTDEERTSHIVPDSIIYSFLAEVIYSDTNINSELIDNKLYGSIVFPSIYGSDTNVLKSTEASVFSPDDIVFIKQQLTLTDSLILNNKIVPEINLIPVDSTNSWHKKKSDYWDNYYKFHNKGYRTICKPLFSQGYTLAIVMVGGHCGGLCGWREFRIYQKKSKWVLLNQFHQSVS